MKTVLGSWRRIVIVAVGGLALALAGLACSKSHSGEGNGGLGGNGPCSDPNAPVPPQTACSSDSDCPLPKSVTQDDGEYTTVYYYSDPTCSDGVCRYCVTSTMTEDPGVTGVP